MIELLALLVLTVLGILNFHPDRVGQLFSGWVVGNSSGGLDPVAFGVILTATASAVFAYNGYSNAVNFSEETKGSSRNIATAILLSLVITVAAELIPTTAVLLGAPDLAAITASSQPMIDFIDATANKTVDTIVSLGVALAIFNATLAIILEFGRILYSASRDRAWPGVINDWLVSVHPTLKSPWIATALVGIVSAILCLTVDLNTLITLTGAALVADYAFVAIARAGRPVHRGDRGQPVPDAALAAPATPRSRGVDLHHDPADHHSTRSSPAARSSSGSSTGRS